MSWHYRNPWENGAFCLGKFPANPKMIFQVFTRKTFKHIYSRARDLSWSNNCLTTLRMFHSTRTLKVAQDEGEYKSMLKEQKINKESAITKLKQSKKIVQVAIFSNSIILTSKVYGFITSGSASMFAESMHSLADVVNQGLLMYGLLRSLKKPDFRHPYGYEGEKYAWALLSGCSVFFLGGGVTLYHGISGLFEPAVLLDIKPALAALAGCFMFESISMTFAFRQVLDQSRAVGMGFFSYLFKSADPSSVQVLLEDSASLFGICIASTCLVLAKYLSLPMLDSVGSITIGVLLSIVGMFLVRRNMLSLTGRSMDPIKEQKIIDLIKSVPVVKSVHFVKSTSIGPDWVRFKAEILFDGRAVAERYFETNPHKHRQNIEMLKSLEKDEDIEEWMRGHGDDILKIVGKEIDRLEILIQQEAPEVKHIDLEIL
jgi:zinc transporter 9